MSLDLYRKLVDLYAAHELPLDLEQELERVALVDRELAEEMRTLRETYDALRGEPEPEYNEETHQRILMKIYAKGAEVRPHSPEPAHFQYSLPMQS